MARIAITIYFESLLFAFFAICDVSITNYCNNISMSVLIGKRYEVCTNILQFYTNVLISELLFEWNNFLLF